MAAFVGALLWAVVVNFTKTEAGWFAWGIGALVGLVMSNMTAERSRALALHAAMLAATGLASGKVMTLLLAAPYIEEAIVGNPDVLRRAFFLDMRDQERYSPEINVELAKLDPRRDTIPDDLRERMVAEADARMEAAPPAERKRVARDVWRHITMEASFMQKLVASLGIFDFLWFFLAIGTAWKFMTSE